MPVLSPEGLNLPATLPACEQNNRLQLVRKTKMGRANHFPGYYWSSPTEDPNNCYSIN